MLFFSRRVILFLNSFRSLFLDDNSTEQNAIAEEQTGNVEKNTNNHTESVESAAEKNPSADDPDKEPESESHENKRPASRESTTSTTSNSSERLIIRSANDLNKLVVNVADAFIKKEKLPPQEQCEEQTKEKPHGGLSVVNPSQLGVSNSGGENLLQNVNFAQPNDQMNVINYIGGNAMTAQVG